MFTDGVHGNQIGETWLHHLAHCEERIADGKTPVATQGFEEILEAQLREDEPGAVLTTAVVSWTTTTFIAWKAIEMLSFTA